MDKEELEEWLKSPEIAGNNNTVEYHSLTLENVRKLHAMLEAESDALKLEIRQQAALEAESDALKLEICQQAANIEYLEDCLREIRFIAIGAIRHPDIG